MVMKYPGSLWVPLSTRQTEPMMTSHDVACLHTMVGTLMGTDSYFRENGFGGTESHWGLGYDGAMRQWQDGLHQADANYNGNPYVLSLETADKGTGFPAWVRSDVPAWTQAQLDAIVRWLVWITSKAAHAGCPAHWQCHNYGIPRSLIPDTKPGRRGIGYHRQGIDGNYPDGRVAGGVVWSASDGKVCPGDRRIYQLKTIIIPRVQAASAVVPPLSTSPEEDEMFLYSAPGEPVFFCDGGVSVGINEPSDMQTFVDNKVKHFKLDSDTFAKFRSRYPGA